MIAFIICCFVFFAVGLALLMSYELRHKASELLHSILPQGRKKLKNAQELARTFSQASAPEKMQSHWHLQQWWILIAGFFIFVSVLIFAITRPISSTKIEADYLKEVDPQIYSLLNGEMLSPPPEVDENLVEEAIVAANRFEQQQPNTTTSITPTNPTASAHDDSEHRSLTTTRFVDRKWDKLNPRYKQRLLMTFKIMKERHGYEMVLLEGYRSPDRQNLLSADINTTRARGYQSYHQFGLAADVAFKRNGKVVISERDPWAMRGYELYGDVSESVGLTWGGRWKSIKDFGHTEYRMPGLKRNKETAEQLLAEAELASKS